MIAFTPAQSRRRMVARLELAGSALCFGLIAILARKLTLPGMCFTAGEAGILYNVFPVNAATIYFFFCLAGLPVVLPFALTPLPGGVIPWALAVLMSVLA